MRALSLEYHDVVDGPADQSGFPGAGPASYKLDRASFERHLAAIAKRVSQPPTRVVDWLDPSSKGSPLFLTFDDGGVSASTIIADALERLGWRGHFFVTGSRIDTPTFLSPPQIRDLHARGHVIGSHSQTHPARMGACSDEQLRQEWARSIAILTDILGAPVPTASVPGGFYSRSVGVTAEAAGIRYLFTSAPTTRVHRVGNCLVLGRYTVRRWSSDRSASAMAAGAFAPRAVQTVLYRTLTLVRRLGGEHYLRVRQHYWKSRT